MKCGQRARLDGKNAKRSEVIWSEEETEHVAYDRAEEINRQERTRSPCETRKRNEIRSIGRSHPLSTSPPNGLKVPMLPFQSWWTLVDIIPRGLAAEVEGEDPKRVECD